VELNEVIKAFQNLGYTRIGKGPKHPEGDAQRQAEIDEFLARYPQVKRDKSFVEFFEYYSALAIDWPNEALTLVVHGFSPDISLEIARPEEPLVDEKNFFRFAEIIVQPGPNGERAIGSLYAFDTTEQRRSGIYQKTKASGIHSPWPEFEWYCETFIEWLSRVVDTQAPFTDSRYRALRMDLSYLDHLILFEPEITNVSTISSNIAMNWLLIALPDYANQSIHLRWVAEKTYEIFLTPKPNQDPNVTTVSADEVISKIKEYLDHLKQAARTGTT